MLSPLYKLLQKSTKWHWTAEQSKVFSASKDLLTSSGLLVHFDPKLSLTLVCDASTCGLGAVLAHRYPKGQLATLLEHSEELKRIIVKSKKKA